MLKEILSPSSCAECRLCCGFDRDDEWENPVFDKETAEHILSLLPEAKLMPVGEGFRFALDFGKDGIAYCPALTENGCLLGGRKPFACRIWPYRVMTKGNKLVLTLSPVCEVMTAKSREETLAFGRKIAECAFREAEANPDMTVPYIDGYPIAAEQ